MPLIDGSFRNRLVNRLAHLAGGLIASPLADPRLQPKGQSVTVVYEKL
jgi:hypothetical protein